MKNTCLLYVMILILSNCVLPVDDIYDIVEETTVESEEEAEEITNIEEVQTMELQPIKEYSKYVGSGKRVYGIVGDDLEEILLKDVDDNQHLFNQFFLIDGLIYLSVKVVEMKVIPNSDPEESEPIEKEYFFSQTGGQIDEELEKDFPSMPESKHILYPNDGLFEIIKFPYEIDGVMTDTSRVVKGSMPEGYLKIDGCARVEGGIWFSVSISLPHRLKGVYFLPEDKNKIMVASEGRIW